LESSNYLDGRKVKPLCEKKKPETKHLKKKDIGV